MSAGPLCRRLAVVAVASTVLAAGPAGGAGVPTFAAAGRQATATLLDVWYAGGGLWRSCNASDCASGNVDWGYDSLTYALALRHAATHDSRLLTPLRELVNTAQSWPAPCASVSGCGSWSDVPEWDAIALMDEYEATGDPTALQKAEA